MELYLKKRIPDSLQLLLVAPIALLITGLVSFIAIGPITFAIGNVITNTVVSIFEVAPILGGLIYGGLYAPLVITGMHHTFLAVDLQLIGSTGGTFLWPMVALSNTAQGTAALAMMFVLKDEKLKSMSVTSAVSAYLGITEPAMFGVNLRFRYAFLSAITGSALAGAFISLQSVKAPSIGVGGLPGFLSIFPQNWGSFFIGMAIVLVVPFVLTILFGKMNKAQ
jgi:PTS system trehalose-specific IIC component